ncbi:hypothetical protein, partial [Teichococcus vastitatis]
HHPSRGVQPNEAAAVLAEVDPENLNVHVPFPFPVATDRLRKRGGPFHKGDLEPDAIRVRLLADHVAAMAPRLA